MKIRRFVAKDMRSALAQIKDELGAEAVIMSNKKIPEGVELMAAIDYSQPLPKTTPEIEDANAAKREVSNDVVNIGESSDTQLNEASTSALQEPYISSNANVPADSLSALLNRQVQQSAVIQNQQETTEKNTQKSVKNDDDIEEQLRSFTQRLRYSKPDGTIPAPYDSAEEIKSASADISQEHTSLEAEHMAKKLLASQVSDQKVSPDANVSQQDFDKIQQEMASIRQLLEHQVSGLMWQDMAQKDPQRAVLVTRLLALGLNEQIADQIAGYVPVQTHEAQAWQHATKLISEQINTTQNDIIYRGGVVALVGPTGVGKTTTIAKLAARFAQIHGHEQVALISTDTYRIAGFEQLATYGKIIGCQVNLAKDSEALNTLLQQYSKKKLILIDTAGMGQRDIRLAENLANLVSNTRFRIRNYLVLAANSQQQVMQENVDRFKKVPLSGCIFTKLDESVSIGEIITTSIQNGLPIGYLTDGQRVPEDIKVANAEKLVTLADKMAMKSAKNNTSFMQPTVRSMPIAPAAVIS
ncbi:flagellar biosynthesis protein FlhF [Candidatus Colwellia aromaticivorans]|uniref:flagellar biosynthesis protein FlhF n=1 Tax=Candidatus Colwellia aromaticivorans TaxID=2267621 RepID=UPI000DF1A864|nr:flagellar biosynthesis protein FlhF [Candidatus Colwellia aromaticivorans]